MHKVVFTTTFLMILGAGAVGQQLQGEPIARAYLFGDGTESPPNQAQITEQIKKAGTSLGWKTLPDGKLLYNSPKQMTFVFMPSLREIRTWRTLAYFRKKIEKDGFWAKFSFEELPDFLKSRVESSYRELDFKPNTAFILQLSIVTKITGNGRKVDLPFDLRPTKSPEEVSERRRFMNEAPVVENKSYLTTKDIPESWRPFYQIWNLNVAFESNRSEVVHEALGLLNTEMALRTALEHQTLFAILKGNKQFENLKKCIHTSIDMKAQPGSEDNTQRSIATTLTAFRYILGFNESQDWDNFTQNATIDSLSFGFTVNFVREVKSKKQLAGVGF